MAKKKKAKKNGYVVGGKVKGVDFREKTKDVINEAPKRKGETGLGAYASDYLKGTEKEESKTENEKADHIDEKKEEGITDVDIIDDKGE